jgi:transposase
MKKTKRRFTHEFKVEALKLWEANGRKSNEVGTQLGINPQLLAKWHRKSEQRKTDPAQRLTTQAQGLSSALPVDPAAENVRLRRELARVKMEHEILKKTVGIFSEMHK